MTLPIGVLALQGDFAAHASALARRGATVREVRRCAQLSGLAGLVIPGGESTTLLNLMADEPWFDSLRAFHARGATIFGTCAGAILLAAEVRGPSQPSLGLLDAVVERNAFGRQIDSFVTEVAAPELGGQLEAVFIRAPRFVSAGPAVRVLATHRAEPVLVAAERVLAATFHPELGADPRVHDYFLALAFGLTPSTRRAAGVAAEREAPSIGQQHAQRPPAARGGRACTST